MAVRLGASATAFELWIDVLRNRVWRSEALREFSKLVRDFCATFRENDADQYGRKLVRRTFATNQITWLKT